MGKEVAVRKNTLPANWEQQMKEDAARGRAQMASVAVGQFMSTRGGILAFQGTPVPGNKLQCVVLAYIFENAYYSEEFDPDNPSAPVCYAFGDPASRQPEAEMAPHEQAPDKQNADCQTCDFNKFGSAERGRGKACKNGFRLAVMHADSLKGDLKDASTAFLKIPPTSRAGFAAYVKQIDDLSGGSVYGVVTEVSIVPDPRSQYKVVFSQVKRITEKRLLGAVFLKAKEMERDIAFPYQAIDTAGLKRKPAKPAKKGARQAAPPAKGPGFGERAQQPRRKF
jgi:hypothetical protein